jgi:hypothetical protein
LQNPAATLPQAKTETALLPVSSLCRLWRDLQTVSALSYFAGFHTQADLNGGPEFSIERKRSMTIMTPCTLVNAPNMLV